MPGIQELCNAIMAGVVATGAVTDENAEEAVKIMRAETKAFFLSDRYEETRECVRLGTLHDHYVIADIVMTCAEKLNELQSIDKETADALDSLQ